MYLWCKTQNMPLSPGLLWTKKSGVYQKKIMADQMSFVQIQWLNYVQETQCFDKNGLKHKLQHGYHQGEIEFEGIKPDGYVNKDNKHYFFEFLGTYIDLSKKYNF